MALNLRTLGVRGENLPAKRTLSVIASDFSIGGLLIDTERKFNIAFKINNIEEFNQIFGGQINPTDYGPDSVKGFFDNVSGAEGSLYIQSLLGYDTGGSAIDAVVASRDKADEGGDADAYLIQSAYQDNLQYGAAGNRIGTKFTQVDRFTTAAASTVAATGVSEATLDSVIDIKVGDLICFKTNSGADLVYKIVTQVDESNRKIYWSGNFEVSGASGETLAIDDVVTIPGFKIQTYVKNINGVVSEVDTELSKIICSTESAVTDYYVENIFKASNWIKITEDSASLLGERLPANDTAVTYNISGADGTPVTTTVALDYLLAKFNNLPIRFLAYPESTAESLQKELITYSLSRRDNPIIIINIAEDRTKSQLITIGNNFQVSDYSPSVIVANWLEVTDPFATSPNSPNRHIPNVGHVMGAWIRCIGQLGIHFIPATDATILRGSLGVVGDTLEDDTDRTDVAKAGINVIQNITGTGIKIMNLFTVSTDVAYAFANGILMRNYIKISAEDSLKTTENTPNTFNRIKSSRMALLTFLYNLWFKGSTGTIAEGETFGQSFNEDGTPTSPADHFQVIADITNNPQTSLNLGNQDIWIYFSFPTPAGSIVIGVGPLLLS
jgi:hypothetical protein